MGKRNWAPQHLVHRVPLFFWVAVPVFLSVASFLAFANLAFWGPGPWILTKNYIFDHLPGLRLMSIARFQNIILWQCICMPMLSVHVVYAVLACYLAKQA